MGRFFPKSREVPDLIDLGFSSVQILSMQIGCTFWTETLQAETKIQESVLKKKLFRKTSQQALSRAIATPCNMVLLVGRLEAGLARRQRST